MFYLSQPEATKESLQQASQQLVDRAQEIGAEPEAAISLCGAARHWLARNDLETAASLYVSAIVVGLVGAILRDGRDDALAKGMLMPITLMTLAAEEALAESVEFYTRVRTMLREHHSDWPDIGHQLVSDAIAVAREQTRGDTPR